MSTNYYLLETSPPCEHCGQTITKRRHIGKSSAGWVFILRTYPEEKINHLHEWLPLLQAGKILDEYDHEVSLVDLLITITVRWHPVRLRRHTDVEGDAKPGPGTYDLMSKEFS